VRIPLKSNETIFYAVDCRLKIFNVSEADDGLYRCRVDFLASQTRTSRLNLTVIGERLIPFFDLASSQRNQSCDVHSER